MFYSCSHCITTDGTESPLLSDKLLAGRAFYCQWPEDFEGANVTDEELANAAVSYGQSPDFTLTAADIAQYRDEKKRAGKCVPTGTIVENLTKRKLHQYSKAKVGRQLATDLLNSGALGHATPRPIEYLISWARRATQSDYWATMKAIKPGVVDLKAMGEIYEQQDET